ncbi:hypothetical protein BH10PAT1_BH10PAT1_7160 [soil metagenome]
MREIENTDKEDLKGALCKNWVRFNDDTFVIGDKDESHVTLKSHFPKLEVIDAGYVLITGGITLNAWEGSESLDIPDNNPFRSGSLKKWAEFAEKNHLILQK